MPSRKKAQLVIRNIGQLVTIGGHTRKPCTRPSVESLAIVQISDACLAAESGNICYIGSESDLAESVDASSAEELDANGSLVIPGFIDAHTHSIFAGSREIELEQKLSGVSYLEILGKGGGILQTVRQTRASSDQEIIHQTASRLSRMLKLGTTTVEVKTGYGLTVKDELRLLYLLQELKKANNFDIVPTLLSAHAVPPEFKGNPKRYIRDVVNLTAKEASEKKLAGFFDVFLENGVFSREECREMLAFAREWGFALKIHSDEFSDLGGASLAAEMNVVSADHLLFASNEGLRALASAGVVSVLLPGTSITSFGGSFADARTLINAGGAVALGTDLSPNSWIESMHFVIWLACYCMKMTPAEALVAATINSAHAIKRAIDVGSLEVGKKCNVIVTNMKCYEEIPYRFGVNIAETVVKEGRVVES